MGLINDMLLLLLFLIISFIFLIITLLQARHCLQLGLPYREVDRIYRAAQRAEELPYR